MIHSRSSWFTEWKEFDPHRITVDHHYSTWSTSYNTLQQEYGLWPIRRSIVERVSDPKRIHKWSISHDTWLQPSELLLEIYGSTFSIFKSTGNQFKNQLGLLEVCRLNMFYKCFLQNPKYCPYYVCRPANKPWKVKLAYLWTESLSESYIIS